MAKHRVLSIPEKSLKKILFTSVVGPFGVDSSRSRYKNPMSLLSNQVTRGQMHFTVQMSSRTFAFDLFGANLNAHVAALNFPSPRQFKAVLRANRWDRIGISAIIPNFESLIETYRIVREVLPQVPIDIGGHIVNDDQVVREIVQRMVSLDSKESFRVWRPKWEADRIRSSAGGLERWIALTGRVAEGSACGVTFVKRDGIEYYKHLDAVGLKDPSLALRAPLVSASFEKRLFGIPIPSTSSGIILPDVGCPMACNFCATSHKFGGKFIRFLKSAEQIMSVANAHADLGRSEMFVMSENFSLDTRRALRLLRLMEEQKRPHRFSVFSSANGLLKLGVENIVKLGYSFIWIGLEESSGTVFKKMHGIDLRSLVTDLQSHGVEVLGSTILGFEHQTLQDIDREVEHALTYDCVYNQFMLYMPSPGTPLWEEMKSAGKLKKKFPWPELHGQSVQNWKHPRIGDVEIERRLDRAFEQDFERLGPSLYRMMKVHFSGYQKTKDWSHALVQMRRAEMKKMFKVYVPILGAMYLDLRRIHHPVADAVRELHDRMFLEMGTTAKMCASIGTGILAGALQIEKWRHRMRIKRRVAVTPRSFIALYSDALSVPNGVAMPRVERSLHYVQVPQPIDDSIDRDSFASGESLLEGAR